jgi:hypothetical protein
MQACQHTSDINTGYLQGHICLIADIEEDRALGAVLGLVPVFVAEEEPLHEGAVAKLRLGLHCAVITTLYTLNHTAQGIWRSWHSCKRLDT